MKEATVNGIIPHNDAERIEALQKFEILYTAAEEAFDNLTQMMAQVFNTPMAFISLVDKNKVFYKSQVGPFGKDSVNREDSLCSTAILGKEPLVIEDASVDACFKNTPYVLPEGGIRFYAGAPLITKEGYHIGTVCIVDIIPRYFSQEQKQLLVRFATIVMHEIELRYKELLQEEVKEALMHTQERFDLVTKATQDVIWDWDLRTNLIWWNEGFKTLFGYREAEIEPSIDSWYNRVHPEDKERIVGGIHAVIDRGGKHWSDEYRFRKADGSYATVFDRGYALHDEQGRPYRMLGSMQDITERKNAVMAIEESESNLRSIILNAPVAMCILSGEHFIVELANEQMFLLWGKGAVELMHKPIFEGLPEASNQGLEELLRQVYTTGETFTANERPVTLPRNNKVEIAYLNFVYQPFKNGHGKITGIMAVAIDVTEQVLARMKVEEANKELQFVTDTMPQMVWATESNGYSYFFNKQWLAYTGLTVEELKGSGWTKSLHPDDLDQTMASWNNAVAEGNEYDVEYRVKRYDGIYQWFLARGTPMKDEKGNILKWYGSTTNVDVQKLTEEELERKVEERTVELERANEALVRGNEELTRLNKNLEQFAYAASHDLKEPTRKIHFFAERLKDSLGDRISDVEKKYFERMELASNRMSTLIDDLLTYSEVSQKSVVKEPVVLNTILENVISDLDLEIEQKEATILMDPLYTLSGHKRQWQQAFQNLLGNALKYSKPDVPPVITITCSRVKGSQVAPPLKLNELDNYYYLITVKDNGIGFNQGDAERIFNVFTRLHGMSEYKGSGVGLSIVQKVVQNHNGHIWAESQPEEGAAFKILMPA